MLRKEVSIVKRAIMPKEEPKGKESLAMLAGYIQAIEDVARVLTENDIFLLQQEIARYETLPWLGNDYQRVCQNARRRDLISSYYRLRNHGESEP